MGKSRHTEAQIIAALKQVEAGHTVDDVARECSVSVRHRASLIQLQGIDSTVLLHAFA